MDNSSFILEVYTWRMTTPWAPLMYRSFGRTPGDGSFQRRQDFGIGGMSCRIASRYLVGLANLLFCLMPSKYVHSSTVCSNCSPLYTTRKLEQRKITIEFMTTLSFTCNTTTRNTKNTHDTFESSAVTEPNVTDRLSNRAKRVRDGTRRRSYVGRTGIT